MVSLQVLGLLLKICAFTCSFMIQESAGHSNRPSLSAFPVIPSVRKGMPSFVSSANIFISIAPNQISQLKGTGLRPQLIIPPLSSAPVPQMEEEIWSSPWSNAPSVPPPYLFVSSPTSVEDTVPAMPPTPQGKPHRSEYPPFTLQAPAPFRLPQNEQTLHPSAPGYSPQSSQNEIHENNAPLSPISPVSSVLSTRRMPESPPPSHSVLPVPENTLKNNTLSDVSTPPALPGKLSPDKPLSPEGSPSSPPKQNRSPIFTPPPSISQEIAPSPIDKPVNPYAPVSHSQTEAPFASKHLQSPNSAPAPHPFSKSAPGFHSPKKHHHERDYKITLAPFSQIIPPASSKQVPFVSPKKIPSGSSPRNSVMPLLPPLQGLLSPPPRKDCVPLTCNEPLTYGHPESSCVCVLPIQVRLRLAVALYTFFPSVSELAAEVAAGVFMKQSQVRIVGANEAGDIPDTTIVLIDFVPLHEKFVHAEVYLIFQRFWHKQVVIKPSFFGDYDVLYVRYPGLPPSPPLPSSNIGIIGSKPYRGHDNDGRTLQPLAVDVTRRHHGSRLSKSILVTIIFSAFVAIVLLSAIAWVVVLKTRGSVFQPAPTLATNLSQAKSSVSMAGSGPSSPSFSLGSSIAAYTGSAKTFSSIDVERATNHFNETRILGEGGFGRVYSGVLADGTEVAMKVFKRNDWQGSREFMAEVEMLSRLHHRNLVKLIGICAEDRTRCLVYELIPNGSLESHLHGIDKETAPLNWSARLKIALGAARALAYLHEDASPRVIHRDFKASNILLEEDFTPKVSDFGLARAALDEEKEHISTRVMGTFGYVAPEYAMTGHLLVKSDVYSYGVVLLELLTGRKPVDMSQPLGQENLVSWARPLLTSREGLESIVDATLGPDFPFESISKVAAIASLCVQPEVSDRPSMGEVVQALKLVFDECDEMKELQSRNSSKEDFPTDMEARKSTISDDDYPLDIEREISMSEILSSSEKFVQQGSENFRRYSSSGPLRTGKAKRLWKTIRRLSGSWGSMS